MDTLRFDLSKKQGAFKIMHAVNNGPVGRRHGNGQGVCSNFELYKALNIPYARNHDAAHYSGYGGEHTVDITAIFPNFDADPYDPASYDFACTDEYVSITRDAGTEMFYRLGQKIEHYIKKFNVHPPKDFKKWAVICEHIIRHYNEGWNNGFHYNMKYWEIWCEADLGDNTLWTGTEEQYYDLYEVTSKHLKSCFPHLKIGGPALAWDEKWAARFLPEMKKRQAPLDFFSWHTYRPNPEEIMAKNSRIQKLLDDNGFSEVKNILNEWNYVKSWDLPIVESFKVVLSMKGAAFSLACMTAGQHSSIDMMMYYDLRPSLFNGLFDHLTLGPLKTYYVFLWYSQMYERKAEILCENQVDNLYTLCGVDEDDKTMTLITYFHGNEEEAEDKTFAVDFGREGEYEVYLLDETHDAELVNVTKDLTFTMKPNTCLMIREK
ncbi:MAG: hypothetical protein E7403_00385 [Ruminococcaceae bacterium]|nr:hypothetical protein [Oscillospiraceae bacterium]